MSRTRKRSSCYHGLVRPDPAQLGVQGGHPANPSAWRSFATSKRCSAGRRPSVFLNSARSNSSVLPDVPPRRAASRGVRPPSAGTSISSRASEYDPHRASEYDPPPALCRMASTSSGGTGSMGAGDGPGLGLRIEATESACSRSLKVTAVPSRGETRRRSLLALLGSVSRRGLGCATAGYGVMGLWDAGTHHPLKPKATGSSSGALSGNALSRRAGCGF